VDVVVTVDVTVGGVIVTVLWAVLEAAVTVTPDTVVAFVMTNDTVDVIDGVTMLVMFTGIYQHLDRLWPGSILTSWSVCSCLLNADSDLECPLRSKGWIIPIVIQSDNGPSATIHLTLENRAD
jgi:ABC-type amino acid transport system permease subunit